MEDVVIHWFTNTKIPFIYVQESLWIFPSSETSNSTTFELNLLIYKF